MATEGKPIENIKNTSSSSIGLNLLDHTDKSSNNSKKDTSTMQQCNNDDDNNNNNNDNIDFEDDADDRFSETFSDGGAADFVSNMAARDPEEKFTEEELGLKEARWVFRSKLLVALVLLIAASACAAITFIITVDEDIEDFENQFQDYAHEILEVSQIRASSVFTIMRTLSTTLTSHAIDEDGNTWPFITIPHFEARASEFLALSGALYLSLSPILKPNQRTEWEEYAKLNQDWIRESLLYSGVNDIGQHTTSTTTNNTNETLDLLVNDYIYSVDENNQIQPAKTAIATPFLAPIWQLAPITRYPNLINYDMFDYEAFPAAFLLMLQAEDVAVSQVRNLEIQQNLNPETSKFSWPQSFLLAPVVKRFLIPGDDTQHRETVAILTSLVPWHFYFENILPHGADGIYIVIRNTCNQVFTYVTQGPELFYLGPGDLHENEYTSNGITLDVYFGTEIHATITHVRDETCVYTVTAYPSDEFFGPHDSNKPQVYMFLVIMIFVLTSCVFVVYDRFVQQRQEKVFNTAVQSSAIVSSLFPAEVRRRLMEEAAIKAGAAKDGNGSNNYKKRGNKFNSSTNENTRMKNGFARRNSFSNDDTAKPSSTNSFFASAVANFMENGAGRSSKIRSFALPSNNNGASINPNSVASMNTARDFDIDIETERGKAMLLATKPIADLFPQATVLFADISGFTAWSSVREPSQVFILLEQIYGTFDGIAKRRKIFKVETIGDCYVAASGLPDPRDDHAEAMVKFANECRIKLVYVVRNLEVLLGPDTGDLCCRFGIHSGPVTAGVLRGDKTRFQLFGDTVNTASRIETTGEVNKIHLSESTAKILIDAGKVNWVQKRQELVSAKGKGRIQTYWLTMPQQPSAPLSSTSPSITTTSSSYDGHFMTASRNGASVELGEGGKSSSNLEIKQQEQKDQNKGVDTKQSSLFTKEQLSKSHKNAMQQQNNSTSGHNIIVASSKTEQAQADEKIRRLVDWNVDVLKRLLIQVIQQRNSQELPKSRSLSSLPSIKKSNSSNQIKISSSSSASLSSERLPIDEAVEYISFPSSFDHDVTPCGRTPLTNKNIELSPDVVSQLREYVTNIAHLYPNHPFHSFVHASHVTQSVAKLLSRIIASDDGAYGIANDALTHFACAFSALIHDVDHPGVTNACLVKEEHPLALKYHNKSVAEQNSIDIAWNLLMNDKYEDLCGCIYTTQEELDRFRQIVVTSVLATDIMDKSLGEIRQKRWEIAFQGRKFCDKEEDNSENTVDVSLTRNLKATCVVELLLQASDISHTMQHWHVYSRWNQSLFEEMYKAYKDGRVLTDPSTGWYKEELGFYDFYIIPLAKKLKESCVFGVSGDEYLAYAIANRQEWMLKGADIVKNVYNLDKK